VEVLSSRILLRPADLGRSRHFYRDVLGLAVYREFGAPGDPPGWSSLPAQGSWKSLATRPALPGTRW
jgi:catechol 2,3-dioxygenase-like lactoylglutathione lyase family enzyme